MANGGYSTTVGFTDARSTHCNHDHPLSRYDGNRHDQHLEIMSKSVDPIKHLSASCQRLNKERKRLRSILNLAADCIQDAAHGHTPNWKWLLTRIEAYEDAYAPLGDDC